jgi:hypothetical protein
MSTIEKACNNSFHANENYFYDLNAMDETATKNGQIPSLRIRRLGVRVPFGAPLFHSTFGRMKKWSRRSCLAAKPDSPPFAETPISPRRKVLATSPPAPTPPWSSPFRGAIHVSSRVEEDVVRRSPSGRNRSLHWSQITLDYREDSCGSTLPLVARRRW